MCLAASFAAAGANVSGVGNKTAYAAYASEPGKISYSTTYVELETLTSTRNNSTNPTQSDKGGCNARLY